MQTKLKQQTIQLKSKTTAKPVNQPFIRQLTQLIDAHINDPDLSIEQIAITMTLSRVQLFRKLKTLTGKSPSDFLRIYRLNRAKQLIKNNYGTLSEIAYATGFYDPAHFSKCFKKMFGVTPSAYAKRKI